MEVRTTLRELGRHFTFYYERQAMAKLAQKLADRRALATPAHTPQIPGHIFMAGPDTPDGVGTTVYAGPGAASAEPPAGRPATVPPAPAAPPAAPAAPPPPLPVQPTLDTVQASRTVNKYLAIRMKKGRYIGIPALLSAGAATFAVKSLAVKLFFIKLFPALANAQVVPAFWFKAIVGGAIGVAALIVTVGISTLIYLAVRSRRRRAPKEELLTLYRDSKGKLTLAWVLAEKKPKDAKKVLRVFDESERAFLNTQIKLARSIIGDGLSPGQELPLFEVLNKAYAGVPLAQASQELIFLKEAERTMADGSLKAAIQKKEAEIITGNIDPALAKDYAGEAPSAVRAALTIFRDLLTPLKDTRGPQLEAKIGALETLLKPAPKPEPKPAPDPGPAPEATSPPPTPPITIPPLPRQVEEILDKQYDRSLEGLKQAGADLDFLTKFNLNPYDAAQRQKVEDRKTEFPGIILQIQKDLGLILSCKVSVKDKTTGLMRTEKKTFYILAADHPASSLMIPNGKTLGVGGMAEVYDGRDADGKAVAIKVTKPSAEGPEFGDLKPEERAETEAAAAGAITSKHVVRIFGLGETSSGRPFIVMEKFTEGNLRGIIVGKGMDEKVAAGYLEGLLSGLQAIHDAGIVHRDIKPENIFLVRDPRGGEYYGVHADFGMARRMTIRTGGTDAHTQYLSLLGTPSFIAPELKFLQYLDYVGIGVGTDVWERVAFQRQDDLYAMGVTAYEMLTNEKPRNTMSDQSFGEFCVQIPEKLQKAAELEVRRRILQKRGESLSPGESAQLTTLIGELRAWKAAGGVKDLLAQNAKRVESDPKFTPDLAKIHSPQLREAVAKLLAYDPGNRYQSASQAREAVDDFLKGRTPSPLRPSGAEPTIAAGAAGTGAMRVGSEDIRPVSGSSAAPATPGAAPSRPESWSRVPEGAVIAPPGVAPAPAPAAPPPPPIVFRLPAMSAAAPGAPAPGTSPFQRGATGSSAPPPSFAPAPAEPRRSAVPTAAPSRQFLTGTDEQIMADLDSILVEDVNLTEASLTHISALAFRKALPKEIREKAKGVLNYLTGGEE